MAELSVSQDVNSSDAEMTDLKFLLNRASALSLSDPGPTQEQIELMLRAAVTAADHGRIRPWRFIVMRGDGRKRLGALMAEAERAQNENASNEILEKKRAKALRAPVVIAVLCKPDADHKVPVIEQQYAVAAACQQLMLAAKAVGFGASWKTGAVAYDPAVRAGFGLGGDDSIIGFIYIGAESQTSPLPRATPDAVAQYWDDC